MRQFKYARMQCTRKIQYTKLFHSGVTKFVLRAHPKVNFAAISIVYCLILG